MKSGSLIRSTAFFMRKTTRRRTLTLTHQSQNQVHATLQTTNNRRNALVSQPLFERERFLELSSPSAFISLFRFCGSRPRRSSAPRARRSTWRATVKRSYSYIVCVPVRCRFLISRLTTRDGFATGHVRHARSLARSRTNNRAAKRSREPAAFAAARATG